MQNSPQKYTNSLATYQIKVLGRLDHEWSSWFEDMSIKVEKDDGQTITTLRGDISDQAALHGILTRIRDLGLQLILVQLVDDSAQI